MNPTAATVLTPSGCRVRFGGQAAGVDAAEGWPVLQVALPVLAGAGEERLLADAAESGQREGCFLFRSGAWLAGFTVAAPGSDLESAASELYHRLFTVTDGLHLYRLWNYVPRINAVTQGRENYQHFCRGRSLAFEKKFGPAFQHVLPSASAVGTAAGPLALGFLAGRAVPQHFENPRQVPAFEYPSRYGPRPPSFSRATVVATDQGRRIFISGTAAIRGHASVASQDLDGQLGCTLENLALIGEAAGAGPALGAPTGGQRAFKVFLRHPADLRPVQTRLEHELLRPADTVSYLQAEICRPELLVEIEATLAAGA